MTPVLAAVLLGFVPGLIKGAEQAFQGLAKSGPFKLKTVVTALGQIAEGMLAAGAPLPDGTWIADKSVNDQALMGMVQAEFLRLKATGALEANTPSGDLFLVRGTVVPLRA